MSFNALGLFVGLVLVHNDRKIRLERDIGDWVLGFVDVETGLDYFVFTDGCDVPVRTTIDWLYTEKDAGRLIDPDEGRDTDGRRRTFLGLDKAACVQRDPKSAWRFRWAAAALKDSPETTSDASYKAFIARRCDLINSEDGKPERLPKPSSLRRWVRKLKAARGMRGALVSCAGRLKGQSPLPPLEDWLIHRSALYYWGPEQPKIIDAGGFYINMRDRILNGDNEELKNSLAHEPARLETIRTRARSLQGAATTETRDGARYAHRMFEPAGESVPTERFLERVEMDGLLLRQIVHFSDEWRASSGRMKVINAIDVHTHFWFFPAIFCGPYREDMTAIALMNVMAPPTHLSDGLLEKYPWLAEAFGTMDVIGPDNEKAIFSPGSVSALTELGPDLEMPKSNHPDSKPLVEALNRFIKDFTDGLPGTVRGPRHFKDPTRNAIDEAELTRAQMRNEMMRAWVYWNVTKREYLGNRSPLEMVQACIEAGDRPKRNTPGQIRRGLSKTHDEIVITRDGFEFDGITYQAPELAGVVDANYYKTGFKDRINGTAKVVLSIRTIEGDLHEAEVYDPERNRYVAVYSTQPGYTKFLSRWEHAEFKLMMARETPAKLTEVEKMRLRGDRLRERAADLPSASMKSATAIAGLLECDEVRRASGARAHRAEFNPAGLHGLLATSGASIRTDEPMPVHVPAPPRKAKRPMAPEEFRNALGGEIGAEPGTKMADDNSLPVDQEPEDFAWPDLPDEDDDFAEVLDCEDEDE